MEEKINDLLNSRFTYTSPEGTEYLRQYDRDDVHIVDALRGLFRSNEYSNRNFSINFTTVYNGGYSTLYALSIAFIDEYGYLYHLDDIVED